MKNNNSINQEEIKSYLTDIRKIKVMTPEREKELASIISSGNCTDEQRDEIHQELLKGNLRFVIKVAKKYQNQGLTLPDLIAEGNYGLMKAIENFDWGRNLRFISYAVWWIKQSILQSLNENSRTIRLPVNVVQDMQRAKKEIQNTNKELDSKFTSLPTTTGLDNFINDEGDTLMDLIANTDSPAPDEMFDTKGQLKSKLKDVMSILDDREKIIIEDYFGITGTEKTLEEIGNSFGLTKERVRQIKEKALRKLRSESSILFDYL
jgi:RNA polymerase primary sigma factor